MSEDPAAAAHSALEFFETMPFGRLLGIQATSVSRDEVRGRMEWAPERCTLGGVLHGGALISFADSLGALCAFVNLPPRASTSTIESKTNFFRAVRGGAVEGTSRPLHVGRTTIVVQTDILDGGGRRVAQVTQTQAVLTAPEAQPTAG
ncbi:MAG TPA: PaaI family thioesterase [Candidatus Dormibacteraeota bacterium]|nr:PaaI family thioesterase [Candidatus Dormibacteraeota bacterium]